MKVINEVEDENEEFLVKLKKGQEENEELKR